MSPPVRLKRAIKVLVLVLGFCGLDKGRLPAYI
jgi:hypothetical protein